MAGGRVWSRSFVIFLGRNGTGAKCSQPQRSHRAWCLYLVVLRLEACGSPVMQSETKWSFEK